MLHILFLFVTFSVSAMENLTDSATGRVCRSPASYDILGDAKTKIKERIIALGIAGEHKKIEEILSINSFMDLRAELTACLATLQSYYNSLQPYDPNRVEFLTIAGILRRHLTQNSFLIYSAPYE